MSVLPRWAMVFAAGRGERMRPLSDVLPKPALPLPGGALVGSALRLVAAWGARCAVVNTWHLAAQMEGVVRASGAGPPTIRFSREERLMGTAGGLALAHANGLLGEEGPVLVANGDCLLDLDLAPLLERHFLAGDLVTMALLPHPDPRRWSVVELDGTGQVERLAPAGAGGACPRPLLYTGVMVVARAALASLAVAEAGVGDALWPAALRERRLGGAVVSGSWREVGNPEGYLAAVLELLCGQSVLETDALVAPGALLRSVFLGGGTRVEAGATVVESVVAAGALVRTGALVRRSLLLGAVEACAGETVEGAVRASPLPPAHHQP